MRAGTTDERWPAARRAYFFSTNRSRMFVSALFFDTKKEGRTRETRTSAAARP